MSSSPLSLGTTNSTSSGTLGTGIDVQTFVQAALAQISGPQTQMQAQQTQLTSQTTALNGINSNITTLQSDMLNLTDLNGSFSAMTASSSSSGLLATAGSGAAAGSHTVVVSSLATTSSYYSNSLASSSTTLANGSFTLQVGSNSPVTVTVNSSNNTLSQLAASINSQNDGVTASVITDANGSRLSLLSNTSGGAGNITISGNTTGLTFTQAAGGANASLTVDGIPVSSASNSVTSVIPGVTLNLLTASPNTPITVSVSPDTQQADTAVQQFVNDYNTLITGINQQFSYSPDSGSTAPPLFGDSTLALVQQQLFSAAAYSGSTNSAIGSLSSIGITVNNDGTLSLNTATLNSALQSNYSAVQDMFQNPSTGLGANFNSVLTNLTNPVSSPINVELNGISQEQTSLTSQLADFQSYLNTQQQQLTTEYSQMNSTLQELPVTLATVQAQLGSI